MNFNKKFDSYDENAIVQNTTLKYLLFNVHTTLLIFLKVG